MKSCNCKTVKLSKAQYDNVKTGNEHIVQEDHENNTVILKTCNQKILELGEEVEELND